MFTLEQMSREVTENETNGFYRLDLSFYFFFFSFELW